MSLVLGCYIIICFTVYNTLHLWRVLEKKTYIQVCVCVNNQAELKTKMSLFPRSFVKCSSFAVVAQRMSYGDLLIQHVPLGPVLIRKHFTSRQKTLHVFSAMSDQYNTTNNSMFSEGSRLRTEQVLAWRVMFVVHL